MGKAGRQETTEIEIEAWGLVLTLTRHEKHLMMGEKRLKLKQGPDLA